MINREDLPTFSLDTLPGQTVSSKKDHCDVNVQKKTGNMKWLGNRGNQREKEVLPVLENVLITTLYKFPPLLEIKGLLKYPILAAGLELDDLQSSFQRKPFYDSVMLKILRQQTK